MAVGLKQNDFNLWIVIRKAEALPGQWIAFCPDVDVVTQGNSAEHAMAMIQEAVDMVLVDDISAGKNPLERRAPKEEWDRLWKFVQQGEKVPADRPLAEILKRSDLQALATQAHVIVQTVQLKKARVPTRKGAARPPAAIPMDFPVAFLMGAAQESARC